MGKMQSTKRIKLRKRWKAIVELTTDLRQYREIRPSESAYYPTLHDLHDVCAEYNQRSFPFVDSIEKWEYAFN